MLEVHRSFTANTIRERHGDERAKQFLDLFDGVQCTIDGLDALRDHFGVGDIELPDLDQLARPFQGMSYDSPEAFNQYLAGHLQNDLAESAKGNLYGPLKASLDVLRDLRGVVRKAVEHDGLLPDSQQWFDTLVHAAQLAAVGGAACVPGRAVRGLDGGRHRGGGRSRDALLR